MSNNQVSQNTKPQHRSTIGPKKKPLLAFFTCHHSKPSDHQPLGGKKSWLDNSILCLECSSSVSSLASSSW